MPIGHLIKLTITNICGEKQMSKYSFMWNAKIPVYARPSCTESLWSMNNRLLFYYDCAWETNSATIDK